MSKYIDADALIADLDKGLWGKDYDKVLAEAIIREAPSIEIVRCKECRYRKYRIDYEKEYCLQHSKVLYNTNGGCSWGKGADDEV